MVVPQMNESQAIQHNWWLIEIPYWLTFSFSFYFFGEFCPCERQKIILYEMRFDPCEARLNIEKLEKKTGFLKFYEFFQVFSCSVQSEIILIKSSLHAVRLNPRDVRFIQVEI